MIGEIQLPYTAVRIKGMIEKTGSIKVKPTGLAGLQLDCNGATGDFTLSLSPANLTANRRWTLPNRDDTFVGLGAQTFTGAQTFNSTIVCLNSITGNTTYATDGSTSQVRIIPGGSMGVLDVRNIANNAYLPLSLRGATVSVDNGTMAIADATDATSTTAAALVVAGGVGIAKQLRVGGAFRCDAGTAVAGLFANSVAASYVSMRFYNDQNSGSRAVEQGYGGSAYASALLTGGPAGEGGYYATTGNFPLTIGTNNTARIIISGAGVVACQGALEVNSATLIKSNTTLTDGAAAAVGTLTNAPTAGNPTKWVLINDNGVVRKFPTWT